MRRTSRWVKLSNLPPWVAGLFAAIVIFLPAVLVLVVVHTRSVGAMKDEIRGNLRRLAKSVAVHVDAEAHKGFTSPEQEHTTEYVTAIKPLDAFLRSDVSIKYVYTCVMREGKVYFVLDPTPEGDVDDDGVDDKSHIMQPYDDPSEEMLNAFKFGASTADAEPYEDDWGTFISGYAPIFDGNRELVGIVGVDLTAERYAERLGGVDSSARLGYFVAGLIALSAGLAAALFQKRRSEYLREQAAAKAALEELAESLESANHQLRFASRRFEQLFNLVPVACFTFDRNGTIYEWNRECERLTGMVPQDVVQRTIFETIVGEEHHHVFEELIETVFDSRPTPDREWSDIARDGSRFTVIVNTFPLFAADGSVTGGIAACADITAHKHLQAQNEKQMSEIQRAYHELDSSRTDLESMNSALSDANRQLRKLASVDSLTNILNRRSIFKTLEREAAISKRRSRPLSVLMVDIDHFKALNDTHGHMVGDQVLKSVATRLKSASRLGDHAGRYGGEEFVVVLPDTDGDDAVRVAERVRRQIAADETAGAKVTVSIGVSSWDANFDSIEHFIDAADRALYEAKRTGRNRVVHSRDLNQGAA